MAGGRCCHGSPPLSVVKKERWGKEREEHEEHVEESEEIRLRGEAVD